jgi:hypothetical protein
MQNKNNSLYYCVKCPSCEEEIDITNSTNDAHATIFHHYNQRHRGILTPVVLLEPTVSTKKRRVKRMKQSTSYITSTQQSTSKALFPDDYRTHMNSLEEVARKQLKEQNAAEAVHKKKMLKKNKKYDGRSNSEEVFNESEFIDYYDQHNDSYGQEERPEGNHHDLCISFDSHTFYQQLKNRSTPVSKQFNEQEAFDLCKKLL